jgi:hypothetical protein
MPVHQWYFQAFAPHPGHHFMRTSRAGNPCAIVSEAYPMTLRNRFGARFLACCAFLGLVALTAGINRAAAQQAGKAQERLTYDEKAYKNKAKEIKDMLRGDQAADKQALDLAAQYYAYRLTLTELQIQKDKMHQLVREAVNELGDGSRDDRKSSEAMQLFSTALLARLKEVLPNPRPIASINATIILAHMAKIGQEEATDALADALNDKDMNGGTKVWAAQGLHDFFMLAMPSGDEQPVYFKDKEREARCIKALLGAFDVKMPQNPPPTPEEVDGLRLLRKDVIIALGASRYPAITDAKGASQGNTAVTLIRVLRNDNLNPSPRLDEQLEAAIGLAMLKVMPNKDYKPANEYQLDVGACHLGRFIVDLARQHQNRIAQKDSPRRLAWKTSAARLSVALDSLRKEAAALNRNDPNKYKNVVAYVNEIVRLSLPILKGIEGDGTPAADQLATFLEKSPRDGEPVYKGDNSSVVKPGSAELSTEPAKEKEAADEKKEKD